MYPLLFSNVFIVFIEFKTCFFESPCQDQISRTEEDHSPLNSTITTVGVLQITTERTESLVKGGVNPDQKNFLLMWNQPLLYLLYDVRIFIKTQY